MRFQFSSLCQPLTWRATGKAASCNRFYSQDFISKMPPDTSLKPISRTVGTVWIKPVDEMGFSFTHAHELPVDAAGYAAYQQARGRALVAIGALP